MLRGKIIKKRTKNRETLLRNLRKGKARLEPRCQYETIPLPIKFSSMPQIHHLYADLILMEYQDNLVLEATLWNAVKLYKHVQTVDYANQKLLKLFVENKKGAPKNCEFIAKKLENSDSSEMRAWAKPVRAYCERYQKLLQELKEMKEQVDSNILHSYNEINDKTERTRQNLFKTYPCIELKSQLKDGELQATEFVFNQKYLTEMGYSFDSFTAQIFQEGLPMMIPFQGESAKVFAKMRLENYLVGVKEGFQSSETESSFIMKGGYTKKVKFRHHYYPTYEKGVPGFSVFGLIVAKQKPVLDFSKSQEIKVNTDYIQFMAQRENEMAKFLSIYYDEKAEQNYTNMDKICKIREIRNQEES